MRESLRSLPVLYGNNCPVTTDSLSPSWVVLFLLLSQSQPRHRPYAVGGACGPAWGRSLSLTLCSLKSFPREDVHKVDIMTFCQQKAAQSHKSETPGSRDLALLWQLLVLLCRQNGVSISAAGGWAGAGLTEI